jgi:hypothetical protein
MNGAEAFVDGNEFNGWGHRPQDGCPAKEKAHRILSENAQT